MVQRKNIIASSFPLLALKSTTTWKILRGYRVPLPIFLHLSNILTSVLQYSYICSLVDNIFYHSNFITLYHLSDLALHIISSRYEDLKPPTSPSPSVPSLSFSSASTSNGPPQPATYAINSTLAIPEAEDSKSEAHLPKPKKQPLSPFTM